MRWDWIVDHSGLFFQLIGVHLYLSVLPIMYGLLLSIPLGVLCTRWPQLYPPVLAASSAVYALPAIALFIFLIYVTGLSPTTVITALTMYTLSVLVRNVVDGLRSVPDHVRHSGLAMGFGFLRRLIQIELPMALPVIIAGVRIATVSNISLVSVGSLIGLGGLGQLFTDGFQRSFPTPIIVGIVLTIGLAVAADGLLILSQRYLTPWTRTGLRGSRE